jgi:hypothetical protein
MKKTTIIIPVLILVATGMYFGQTGCKHDRAAKEPPVLYVGHPDSFLGIKFGKPLVESVNSCEGKRADPLHCYLPTTSVDGGHVYDVRRREGSSCMVVEDSAGVEQVGMTIGAQEVDQYREALTKKYGQMTDVSHKIIDNGVGATFEAITYTWDLGAFHILLEGPDRTDGKYGSITAYSRAEVIRLRHDDVEVHGNADQF